MAHFLISTLLIALGFVGNFLYNRFFRSRLILNKFGPRCLNCKHRKARHFHPEYPDLDGQCAGNNEFGVTGTICNCKGWEKA